MTTAPSTAAGHVFVVRGRMERIAHDGAIVPTDRFFSVRPYWDALLGPDTGRRRPERWAHDGRRHGRIGDGRPLWFVDVGRSAPHHDVDWLVAGVAAVLTEAAQQLLERPEDRRTERLLPLLLVPVVGIGGGGFGETRGEVVVALLDAAEQVAREQGVDVAFVTPDPSVHAAVQHLRRERASWPLTADQVEVATSLAQRATSGGLALLLGAGVSVAAGLPTWSGLLRGLSRDAGARLGDEAMENLDALDVAELLRRRLGDRALAARVAAACTTDGHALAHSLLVALGCREVVTTNYDRCYETAADLGENGDALVVLPWGSATDGQPWLLKMHGDVEHPESIVLSRRHFTRYDAEQRPSASVLQTLMLTRHLLVVGASLTDDNVLRLSHEVDAFRESHRVRGVYGTVLDVGSVPERRELWEGELDWVVMPGQDQPERVRGLEIFLDVVAALATTDASWLLDERFEGLLPPEQRDLAADLRRMAGRLPTTDGWHGLAAALGSHGASPADGASTDGSSR